MLQAHLVGSRLEKEPTETPTVLFTAIVASTQHAAATGDERWRTVLQRFGEITAELTASFGGTVVKSTGDGHLATFDGPTQAIRCAEALRADVESHCAPRLFDSPARASARSTDRGCTLIANFSAIAAASRADPMPGSASRTCRA